jgi:hypothetical protein
LRKKGQGWIKPSRAAHDHRRRLRWSLITPALLQQLRAVNQTRTAMQAQGVSTDQTGIRPGQCLFQHTPIARTTQLRRATGRRRQATIQAHGQD